MKKIVISKDIDIPLDVVTQKLAFIGRSGSGKSFAAGKLAEELLQSQIQTVIVDPVGIWHGLRTSADGKKKGISIPIFGGDYGDLPLLEDSGELIANIIVEKRISAVLDVSHLRKNQRKHFITSFAEQLFHLKKKNRSALHLIIEEAQSFIPQRTMRGEERMLGAMEDICKIGRNYGIGISLISQRPQSIHKDCLNQTEALFAFQINGTHERKAITEWVVDKGLSKSTVAEDLSGLKVGQCFLWSPQWLRILEKIKILPKITYDASRTPQVGDKISKSRQLAPVEVEKIKNDMGMIIESKKENDPSELKKKIAQLEKQLKNKDGGVAIQIKKVDKSLEQENRQLKIKLDEYQKQYEAMNSALEGIREAGMLDEIAVKMKNSHYDMLYIISKLKKVIKIKEIVPFGVKTYKSPGIRVGITAPVQQSQKEKSRETYSASSSISAGSTSTLGKCERQILAFLAQTGKCDKLHIAIGTCYSARSGSFNNSMSKLRTSGYIEGKDMIEITESGRKELGPYENLPTGNDLCEAWRRQLGKAEGLILETCITYYPQGLTKDAVATACDYAVGSGSFNNSLSKLRTLGLIEGYKEITASKYLMD